ncbi:hypothetical protein ACFQS6_04395 [Xanthomonas populi]
MRMVYSLTGYTDSGVIALIEHEHGIGGRVHAIAFVLYKPAHHLAAIAIAQGFGKLLAHLVGIARQAAGHDAFNGHLSPKQRTGVTAALDATDQHAIRIHRLDGPVTLGRQRHAART